MRPLSLFIACSLDGYTARPDGGIDWLFSDQDYGYREFYAGIDTVVMGRKTYDTALGFGEYPYPGTRGYVFTRAPRAPDAHVEFVSGDVARFIAELKRASGRKIWLVGGGEIIAECLRAHLVDEYEIFVHPVLLGAGVALFPAGFPQRALRCAGTRHFETGLVQLSYTRCDS